MTPLKVTRKLDSLGRIVIPKKLREQFDLQENQEYEFFLHTENGVKYLCIKCPEVEEEEIARAKILLEGKGFKVV